MLPQRLYLLAVVLALAAFPQAAIPQEPFDHSEVAWQCRDSEHLIELFTVGGRPLNLDPAHKVKILVNHG